MDIAQTRQLRLNFLVSEKKLRAKLSLKGLVVTLESEELKSLEQYLSNQQFLLNTSLIGKLSFMVSRLEDFLGAASSVELILSQELVTLAKLVEYKGSETKPAYITMDSPLDLNISFSRQGVMLNEHLSVEMLPAFMSLEVPYLASNNLLEVIRSNTTYPYTIGRAYKDMDDFLRIDALSPQLLIEAKLPGLFKLNETTFGLASSYQAELESIKGIIIEYKELESKFATKISLPYELSEHSSNSLYEFEKKLIVNKSQVVVWEKGLGRRVFCLATMESFENYPLLIISQASGVWAWKRHIAMIGREGSLSNSELDIQIVTYDDIKRGVNVNSPRAIIFDDVNIVAKDSELLQALKIMDGVMDAYRIGCCSSFPEDLEEINNIMSIVKPMEFTTRLSLVERYPLNPELSFKQHLQPYILRGEQGLSSKLLKDFKRSTVEVVEFDDNFRKKVIGQSFNQELSFDLLTKIMEMISAGTDEVISPKMVKVCELVSNIKKEGFSKTIICTRFAKTQRGLSMLLSSMEPELLNIESYKGRANKELAILKFDEVLPNLREYENVIIVDYPWSLGVIEDAVGSSENQDGSRYVSLIHLRGSVDDRLSIFAARRTEITLLGIDYNQPNFRETKYLLSNIYA